MWSGPRLALPRRRGPLLEPVASYRSRCDRPGESYAGRHGAGDSTRAAPLMFEALNLALLPKSIVNPRTPQNPKSQKALGKAIRQLRNEQGDSQASLAKEAGITPNMLSLIERGEGNPSWTTVEGIGKALGVSVAQLAKLAEKLAASEK